MTGYVREIFDSIQGEGLRVGSPMTFIRFCGCNLSCNYCDTPESQKREAPLSYRGRLFDNPVPVDFLIDKIKEDEVAITGGEPLLQAEFLSEFALRLKSRGKSVYLDTNGTLPDGLEKVIKDVDWVALDFKVPTATGRPGMWKNAERSLRIARRRKAFVKIVVNENLLPRELDHVISIIERVDDRIALVIQPVFGSDPSNLLSYMETARKRLKEVRIIPQIHKYLHIK